jgi:putative ABC transport system ATP-binding protein
MTTLRETLCGRAGSPVDIFTLQGIELAKGNLPVLRNIDWKIPRRKISIILGPSGSGKTSLLRLLNRLDEPTGGSIYYDGEPIGSRNVRQLRLEVGMVFQRPELFDGTIGENILFGPNLHCIDIDVGEILDLVAIERVMLDRDVSTLSGGQVQKVSIGRAIAVGPRVLLLDEPTSGLDPTATLQIESLVKTLVAGLGITCVFVTHQIDQARRIGDNVLVLIDGSKVEEGSVDRVLDHPRDQRTMKFVRGELK